ncbi:Carnosine N-methyltransferase [Diplonema papillatum]|nr:Carnosine N-methyltransferase [Diplonema papillatum]
MGMGTLLASLLDPGSILTGELGMDPNEILQKELDGHLRVIGSELDGFHRMSTADKKALGDLFNQRVKKLQGAMHSAQNFHHLFRNRRQRRETVVVDRVTPGQLPSMGYCNMHDLLIQFVRDWGEDNGNVRKSHHDIVLKAVLDLEAERRKSDRNSSEESPEEGACAGGERKPRVLVPGDALCRMSWDLSNSGLFGEVEANEASPLFAEFAHFILNCVEKPFTVHPHAAMFYNQDTIAGHLRQVMVPTPFPDPGPRPFTLTVGGFELLYRAGGERHRTFDYVVTCFFLDTIPGGITRALTIISELLAPGGVWVNHGPLLYRGDEYPKLSWEEILALLPSRKLAVERTEHVLNAEYCEKTENTHHPTIYNPRFLVARKTA